MSNERIETEEISEVRVILPPARVIMETPLSGILARVGLTLIDGRPWYGKTTALHIIAMTAPPGTFYASFAPSHVKRRLLDLGAGHVSVGPGPMQLDELKSYERCPLLIVDDIHERFRTPVPWFGDVRRTIEGLRRFSLQSGVPVLAASHSGRKMTHLQAESSWWMPRRFELTDGTRTIDFVEAHEAFLKTLEQAALRRHAG